MNKQQLHINHLIKTLAEKLREAARAGVVYKNGTICATKERALALKAASQAVADIGKLGMDYNTAFDKAETLNKQLA